jgi:hypothetical protein
MKESISDFFRQKLKATQNFDSRLRLYLQLFVSLNLSFGQLEWKLFVDPKNWAPQKSRPIGPKI